MSIKSLTTLIESCGLILVKVENGLGERFNRVLNEINAPYRVNTFEKNVKICKISIL